MKEIFIWSLEYLLRIFSCFLRSVQSIFNQVNFPSQARVTAKNEKKSGLCERQRRQFQQGIPEENAENDMLLHCKRFSTRHWTTHCWRMEDSLKELLSHILSFRNLLFIWGKKAGYRTTQTLFRHVQQFTVSIALQQIGLFRSRVRKGRKKVNAAQYCFSELEKRKKKCSTCAFTF